MEFSWVVDLQRIELLFRWLFIKLQDFLILTLLGSGNSIGRSHIQNGTAFRISSQRPTTTMMTLLCLEEPALALEGGCIWYETTPVLPSFVTGEKSR